MPAAEFHDLGPIHIPAAASYRTRRPRWLYALRHPKGDRGKWGRRVVDAPSHLVSQRNMFDYSTACHARRLATRKSARAYRSRVSHVRSYAVRSNTGTDFVAPSRFLPRCWRRAPRIIVSLPPRLAPGGAHYEGAFWRESQLHPCTRSRYQSDSVPATE